jgi:hypothetical protein
VLFSAGFLSIEFYLEGQNKVQELRAIFLASNEVIR